MNTRNYYKLRTGKALAVAIIQESLRDLTNMILKFIASLLRCNKMYIFWTVRFDFLMTYRV